MVKEAPAWLAGVSFSAAEADSKKMPALQSNKSTQFFDRFGGVAGFLGCQDEDLASALVHDAVMNCRACKAVNVRLHRVVVDIGDRELDCLFSPQQACLGHGLSVG